MNTSEPFQKPEKLVCYKAIRCCMQISLLITCLEIEKKYKKHNKTIKTNKPVKKKTQKKTKERSKNIRRKTIANQIRKQSMK